MIIIINKFERKRKQRFIAYGVGRSLRSASHLPAQGINGRFRSVTTVTKLQKQAERNLAVAKLPTSVALANRIITSDRETLINSSSRRNTVIRFIHKLNELRYQLTWRREPAPKTREARREKRSAQRAAAREEESARDE